jgi:hypothetical protein
LEITCDDELEIFVDGKEKNPSGAKVFNMTSTISIPKSTITLAIKCKNYGGPYGIVGHAQEEFGKIAFITDDTWRCTAKLEEGWQSTSFNESDDWEAAESVAKPPHGPYSTRTGMTIWTKNGDRDTIVYCRKSLDTGNTQKS